MKDDDWQVTLMLIRHARPEDNAQLLEIERNSPQGRSLRLLTERKDYFVRASRFADHLLMVAENPANGVIMGVMGIGFVQVTLGGKPCRAGLIFDWRANHQVDQGLPRHMLRLWQAIQTEAAARSLDFIFGYVKADNHRSLDIVLRSGASIVEDRVFLTLPVPRTGLGCFAEQKVVETTGIDAASDINELRLAHSDLDLLPDPDQLDHLQSVFDHNIRCRLSCGKSSLKIWDTTADYTHRVMQTPLYFHAARPFINLAGRLLPLPHVPAPGEEIREWFLHDIVAESPQNLKQLLAAAKRLARKSGVDYLIACLNRAEPAYHLLSRRAWFKLDYHLLFQPLKINAKPSPPTWFDARYL